MHIESPYFIEKSKPNAVNKDAESIRLNFNLAFGAYTKGSMHAYSMLENSIKKEFLIFKDSWLNEIMLSSNTSDIINNKHYYSIIKLGKDVIPYILEDLRQNNNHWFSALTKITGDNPVPVEHLGNISKMTNDWIAWGKTNGWL